MSVVVVVVGGGQLPPGSTEHIESPVAIIAADSGLDHAVAAGLEPTHLVGDLDSLSASGRMWAYAHRIPIDEFPTDKDATDTQLALSAAAHLDADDLLLLSGVDDDRLDHLLGTIAALGAAPCARFRSITARLGYTTVHTVHAGRSCVLNVAPGATFSMLALHGPCSGISLTGAEWPLDHAQLEPGTTRGISNEATTQPWVTCGSGVLTVVVP